MDNHKSNLKVDCGSDHGGSDSKGPGTKDWKSLWKQLRAIEKTIAMRRHGQMGPRGSFAFFVAACSCLGLMLILSYFDLHGLVANIVPFVVPIAAFYLVISHSNRPKTWTEKLDQQLTAYEPIDRNAFRQLQARTRERGHVETDFVYEWLSFEREAIEVAAGWRKCDTAGFLNKQV